MTPADLALPPPTTATSGGVRIQWLGTAGFAIEHDGFVLLIDPYLTRASLATCLTTALQPALARLARVLPRADAIVLSHTHFDHALDVPALAKQTGAPVFGSTACATSGEKRMNRRARTESARIALLRRLRRQRARSRSARDTDPQPAVRQ